MCIHVDMKNWRICSYAVTSQLNTLMLIIALFFNETLNQQLNLSVSVCLHPGIIFS